MSAPGHEPVACHECQKLQDEIEHIKLKAAAWKSEAIVWKSAYDVEVGWNEQNAKQRSKPLTDEQILSLWFARFDVGPDPVTVFARAIEAAHGINTGD